MAGAWEEVLVGQPGSFSVCLRSGPLLVEREADLPHYAASTMKLVVLGAVLAHGGLAGLEAQVQVRSAFTGRVDSFRLRASEDQDPLTWQQVGRQVRLAMLVERMIIDSSNIATNLVMTDLGPDPIAAFLSGRDGDLRVERLIGDSAAEASGYTNTVTARSLETLMSDLTDGSLLPQAETRFVVELLSRQRHRRMIPAGLPGEVWSGSKGGWVEGVKHDVAYVRPEQLPPFVLAICTSAPVAEAEGEAIVARLAGATWREWSVHHS